MNGVNIRITDELGTGLADRLIGELEIKGNVVTPGYLFNQKASDELFRDEWRLCIYKQQKLVCDKPH